MRAGLLVALPTETVYGLGANATDAQAVARIFEVKGRPRFDPLIVHVPDADAVAALAQIDDARTHFARLTAAFWPGPLTLVLPRRPTVPDLVTSGLPSVAVRVPRHPVTRAVLVTGPACRTSSSVASTTHGERQSTQTLCCLATSTR
ncbi:MAG: L-threonylcarbamoyladenylate synthase [Myxococcales bacterium]|nr:L-threonylcarbamoyladenylate synthase [Myxococcales bacterium]